VRVIVVNYHGDDLTLRCLESLVAMTWPRERLQVVLVDNGSDDGMLDAVRSRLPHVLVLQPGSNLGFGGGCNLGLRGLGEVDQVALVNNDATVASDWLEPLSAALQDDPTLGAACPRILFAASFVELSLDSPTTSPGWGDRRELGVRLSGVRVGGEDRWRQAQLVSGFWGVQRGDGADGVHQWTGPSAQMRVPVTPGASVPDAVDLQLAADIKKSVTVRSGSESVEVRVGKETAWFRVPLAGPAYDVINNVGSQLVHGEFGADRGFLEPDHGQFDEPADVFAWCGGAVLLARRYLDDVGLFDQRYFLYYEDLDLAWRGRARGWRYRYVPTSVVRHVHSATSDQSSALFAFYNERNRLLTLARNAPARRITRSAVRSLLITGSYLRRDVLSPLLRGNRPCSKVAAVRLRALVSFVCLLPGTLALRWRDEAIRR
jgi:GT2 family glycosyltransferase